MKSHKVGKCYLCGKIGKMSHEHVPPKFLSPKSPDSEFAKISACDKCNSGFSHKESKFRDFLATASAHKGNKSADDAYTAARRNFQRNPIARLLIGPNKDLKRIVSSIKRQDIYTPNGIYLGTRSAIYASNDLEWKDVLIKIARGLHYLYSGEVIPKDYDFGAKFIQKIEFPDLYEQCKIRSRAGDFFHFAGGWTKEDPKTGLWYMVFYKKIGALVWFVKPDKI